MEFKDWNDPYPAPVIEEYDGIQVVRDDLIQYGSKVRFLDYMVGHDPDYAHIEEWVFGSVPFCGYAQISLPVVCNRYGKKAVLFMANRSMDKLHEYQKRGLALGAEYHWVNMGMLTVTQKRARDYVAASPSTRMVLPLGLEHPSVLKSIVAVASRIEEPDHFWSVGSSGTLNRGLQQAWPNAKAFVVKVGHNMTEREIGRATRIDSKYKFDANVKPEDAPPFPSAPNYDAKAWSIIRDYYKTNEKPKKVLLWNVGA